MTSSAASVLAATRTQRSVISSQRQRLARGAAVGEIIAMQSADDSEGFSFWLARVESVAYQHADNISDNHGRKFVRGGWYIGVRYYERFPTTSPSIFKLGSQVLKENAEEGVIARNVPWKSRPFGAVHGQRPRVSRTSQLP